MCTLASTTNSFSTPTRTRATEAPRLPAVHRQPPKRWRFSFAYSSSVAPSPFLSALEDAAYPVVATPLLLEAVRSAAAATVEAATAAATVAQPSTPSSAVTLAAASAAATSFTAAATATATATASAAAQAVARLAAESDDVPAPSNASSSPRSRSAGNTLSQSLKHAHALPGNAVLLESALELVSPARRPAGIATDFEQLQRASASEKTPLLSGPGGLGSNFFTFQGSVVCSHTRLQESRTRTGNKLRTKIEESLASLEREFESSVESRYQDARDSFSATLSASVGAAHETITAFESGLVSSAAAAVAVDAIVGGPVKQIATAAAWQAAANHDDYPRAKLLAIVQKKRKWNALRWSTHLDDLLWNEPRASEVRPAFEERWARESEFMNELIEDYVQGNEEDAGVEELDFCSRTSTLFSSFFLTRAAMDEPAGPASPASSRASSRASSPGPAEYNVNDIEEERVEEETEVVDGCGERDDGAETDEAAGLTPVEEAAFENAPCAAAVDVTSVAAAATTAVETAAVGTDAPSPSACASAACGSLSVSPPARPCRSSVRTVLVPPTEPVAYRTRSRLLSNAPVATRTRSRTSRKA